MSETPVPILEVAYPQLRPLFFAALGRLARHGFVVSPDDSMDLVHDFFAEVWNGLERNFNPEVGNFESYAYGAFIRFARPRIIRLKRWQNSLIATHELDSFPDRSAVRTERLDEALVRQALANLPGGEQGILQRYIYGEYASERRFAKELGISRYHLREILVGTLGRLAVSLDKPSRITPQDWDVACALWRDRRTIQEASAVLGMTAQRVRSANSRNVRFLAGVLKHYQPRTWSPERKRKMEEKRQLEALEILKNALQSPNDLELLASVRVRGQEILQALELSDTAVVDQTMEGLRPEWVADVYQAIFEAVGVDRNFEANPAALEAEEAHEDEDITIGKAFRDTLLADLPDYLRYPADLMSLPEITADEQAHLRRAPDVVAGKPESEWWLMHGIRPVTVFYAIESISGLLNRYIRRGRIPKAPLILGDESIVTIGTEEEKYALANVMRGEISRRAECRSDIAAALYAWILQVGQRKRWLFKGFEAEPGPGGSTLRLTITTKHFEQTYQRWGVA